MTLASWRQPLSHSSRRLSESPGVVLSVVLSIGLGIQVANQAFVDHVFSGQNPRGRRVNCGGVKNIKSRTIGEQPAPYSSALAEKNLSGV